MPEAHKVERVKGIEPSSQAWEACVLPLNYTRAEHIKRKIYQRTAEIAIFLWFDAKIPHCKKQYLLCSNDPNQKSHPQLLHPACTYYSRASSCHRNAQTDMGDPISRSTSSYVISHIKMLILIWHHPYRKST